ncbi:MAG: hypothetical protein Q8Q67_01910 [bacterium]|nr:hypothetical protein [bacterium]
MKKYKAKPLFRKKVSPMYFYLSLSALVLSAFFLIRISYDLIVIEGAQATVVSSTYQELMLNDERERELPVPIPTSVRGEVIASFAGGEDIGIRSQETGELFYVSADGLYVEEMGKEVFVYGRITSNTCAYESVFGGCVPDISAQAVTSMDYFNGIN